MQQPDTDADRRGRVAARVLVVLASLAILLALVAAYARQSTVDSDQFANSLIFVAGALIVAPDRRHTIIGRTSWR